jgi:tellurite resistance protein TehA-like permease
MFRFIGLVIRRLFPGYFALVMATGIVSIGAFLLDMPVVAWGLFLVNAVAYAALCVLTVARLVVHTGGVLRDLASYNRGPGFLTSVAATCIVGSQAFLLLKSPTGGVVFWLVGLVLWFVITYALFMAVIANPHEPDTSRALHGGWLVPVVATQSVAVLGALLAPEFPTWAAAILFIALCMFLLGSMLYVILITLIFHRLAFSAMTARDFTPPYWIDMGAVAISTLAGSTLALDVSSWGFLQRILPFLLGLTLLFWVTATWWIPLLVALEVWRHGVKRYPLRYSPLYWDMVFPLGMYTTCTLQFARVTGLRLATISQWLIYLALAAWVIVFFGLLRRIARSLSSGRRFHRVGYRRVAHSAG